MKKNLIRGTCLIAGLLILNLPPAILAPAQAEHAVLPDTGLVVPVRQEMLASLDPVQGLVQHQSYFENPQDLQSWHTVTERTLVQEGDRIRTNGDGLAFLTFFEGIETEIGPNTLVVVSTLNLPDDPDQVFEITLDVLVGQLFSNVETTLDAEDRFEIHTPGASAVVRGTRWWTIVDPRGNASFATEFGVVNIIPHRRKPPEEPVGAAPPIDTPEGITEMVPPSETPSPAMTATRPPAAAAPLPTSQPTEEPLAAPSLPTWTPTPAATMRPTEVAMQPGLADESAAEESEAPPAAAVPDMAWAAGFDVVFQVTSARSISTDRSGNPVMVRDAFDLIRRPGLAELALPDCGDGVCRVRERATCPVDCPGAVRLPACGNGVCEPERNEDLLLCAEDCGPWGGPTCGNGTCDATESGLTCPDDCRAGQYFRPVNPLLCGNGTCDPTESALSCPIDCRPSH